MAARERRELASHFEVLLKHLLKWWYHPNRRGTSWGSSVKVSRRRIEDVLEDSPSFRRLVPELIGKAYSRALTDAAEEMRLTRTQAAKLPASCPWTLDQLATPAFGPPKGGEGVKPSAPTRRCF